MLQYDTPPRNSSVILSQLNATLGACRKRVAASGNERAHTCAFLKINTSFTTPELPRKAWTSALGSPRNSPYTRVNLSQTSSDGSSAASAASATPWQVTTRMIGRATPPHKKEPAALVRQLVPKVSGSELVAKLAEPDSSVIYSEGSASPRGSATTKKGSVVLSLTNLPQVGPDFDRRVSAYFREGRV